MPSGLAGFEGAESPPAAEGPANRLAARTVAVPCGGVGVPRAAWSVWGSGAAGPALAGAATGAVRGGTGGAARVVVRGGVCWSASAGAMVCRTGSTTGGSTGWATCATRSGTGRWAGRRSTPVTGINSAAGSTSSVLVVTGGTVASRALAGSSDAGMSGSRARPLSSGATESGPSGAGAVIAGAQPGGRSSSARPVAAPSNHPQTTMPASTVSLSSTRATQRRAHWAPAVLGMPATGPHPSAGPAWCQSAATTSPLCDSDRKPGEWPAAETPGQPLAGKVHG